MKPDAHIRDPPHSPVFWIGIVLCLAAIWAIYLGPTDLIWRPASGR